MHEWQNLVFHNHKTLSPYTAWQRKNIKAFHVGRIGHFNFIKEGFVFFHLWFNTHWQFCIHKKTISINSTHWLVCLKINCVWVVYLHSHYNTVPYTTSKYKHFCIEIIVYNSVSKMHEWQNLCFWLVLHFASTRRV